MAVDINLRNSNSLVNIATNFERVETALQETLSRYGNTPNQMEADIDLNGNDLLNINVIDADSLSIKGVDISNLMEAAVAASIVSVEAAEDAKAYADIAKSIVLDKVEYIDFWYSVLDGGNYALTLARAAANVPVVKFIGGKDYSFKTSFVWNNNLTIEGNGATIVMDNDIAPVYIDYGYLNQQNVSSITQTSVDMGAGTSGTTPVSVVNVTSSAGYVAGDVVKIVSDDLVPGVDPTDNEKFAEFSTVFQIIGNAIYLRNVLLYQNSYVTTPKIARVDTSKKFSIDNMNFKIGASYIPAWNEVYVTVYGAAFPYLNRLRTDRGPASLLDLTGCYGAKTSNFVGRNLETDVALNKFGYGISSFGSAHGEHSNHFFENVRHGYTDGSRSPVGDLRRYGGTMFDRVINSHVTNPQNTGWDTHPAGYGIEFVACTTTFSFNGPTGSRQGFAFRGTKHRAVDCTVHGGSGFVVFPGYGHPLASTGHEYYNCRHIANPSVADLNRHAFRAEGKVGAGGNPDAIVDVKYINCSAEGTNSAGVFYAERATVDIINPIVKHVLTGTQSAIIEANLTSTVRLYGGRFDVTGSSGTNLAMFKCDTVDSSIRSDGNVKIVGASGLNFIANCSNIATTMYLFGIDTDFDWGSSPVYNASTSTLVIDFVVNNGRASGYNLRVPPTLATGNNTVTIQYRGAKEVFVRLRSTNSSVVVNNISAGNIIGQRLVIVNRTDSTNTITIQNGGTNISIVSDIVLAVGQATQLIWDGTTWLRAV